MELKQNAERNPALDVIRCVAFFGVISVHFIKHNGFYEEVVLGKRLIAMALFRSLFMYCVPLFMLLTGYLLCQNTVSARHYKKLGKTYFIYVVASLFCLFGYPLLYAGLRGVLGIPEVPIEPVLFRDVILGILGFTAAPYAWYVEMYLGLFLMIPFLNILYRNIPTRRQKELLLLIGIVLTALPTILNSLNFTQSGWWSDPTMVDANHKYYAMDKLIPAWWTGIYPLTYYFIGCYLRERQIRCRPWKLLLLGLLTFALSGCFSLWRSMGVVFIKGDWVSWNSVFNFALAVFMFLFFLNLDYGKMPKWIGRILAWISDACFGAYLVSWVYDSLLYPVLAERVPQVPNRLFHYFIIVPLIFVLSVLTSSLINLLYRLLRKLIGRIAKRKEAGDPA